MWNPARQSSRLIQEISAAQDRAQEADELLRRLGPYQPRLSRDELTRIQGAIDEGMLVELPNGRIVSAKETTTKTLG